MDKSPHQLKRTMSTSSEEFSKFVNRLLYEDTSNINSPTSLKHRTSENINKLTNFQEGVNIKNIE